MSLETVPKELRNLRSCLMCSLVKPDPDQSHSDAGSDKPQPDDEPDEPQPDDEPDEPQPSTSTAPPPPPRRRGRRMAPRQAVPQAPRKQAQPRRQAPRQQAQPRRQAPRQQAQPRRQAPRQQAQPRRQARRQQNQPLPDWNTFDHEETMEQFEFDGCDNCEEYLHMKNNRDAVYECTSSNFDGIITLIGPEDSWVAKWQRISQCVKGCYATSVTGRLPPGIIRELKSKGYHYRTRDTSQKI